MLIVGIDVGLDGAVAVMWNGRLTDTFQMPTRKEVSGRRRLDVGALYIQLARVLDTERDILFAVEQQGPISPGRLAVFQLGRQAGAIEAIVQAFIQRPRLDQPSNGQRIRYVEVPSRRWKHQYGLWGQEKEAIIDRLPNVVFMLTQQVKREKRRLSRVQLIAGLEAFAIGCTGSVMMEEK